MQAAAISRAHGASVVHRATKPGAQAVPYLPFYSTKEGEEVLQTLPHQANALQWVCLRGDKLFTSSSTTYLSIINPLPS